MDILAFGMPSWWEMSVILIIGLLLFGRRLPEVGRSLGRSIVEFKKGIKGIEDDIESESGRREGGAIEDDRKASNVSQPSPRLNNVDTP